MILKQLCYICALINHKLKSIMENQIEKLNELYLNSKENLKKSIKANPHKEGMIIDFKYFSFGNDDSGLSIETVHETKAIVVEIIDYYSRVMYIKENEDVFLSLIDTRKL